MKNLIMLVYIAIVSQVQGEIPSSISCTLNQCYTAYESVADFQTALDLCQKTEGHLMTVRSGASNGAMRELFTAIKGEFWIGLKFNGKNCTDTSELKGYEWITGDTQTDFTNWNNKNSDSLCDPTCVSVSRDLKWIERPCHDNLDGFLCEHSFQSICYSPENLVGTGESVVYVTPFGNEGEGSISLPPGTVLTIKPSGNKYICSPDNRGWLSAPWNCEVFNGGCERECVKNGNPQCTCPPGEALQDNGVACVSTPNDPCVTLGCEHICLPDQGSCLCRDGYELTEDGKGCRDVDECRSERICPISECVNTIGSYECKCPVGFTGDGDFCVDINECFTSPCEHVCENTEGSYTCSCFEGHVQSTDDPTKCKLHCDQQKCPAKCDINNPEECECPFGFIVHIPPKDIPMCLDIDECATNFCSHGCTNTFGSYICSCPAGFTLVAYGECVEEESGSATPPPLETVTPTSKDTTEVTTAMTPGGLLGITVCIVLIILIIVFLVHQMSRRRSSWECTRKNQGEDLQDLQQVTTEKYTKKSSFVNRNLKEDTYN